MRAKQMIKKFDQTKVVLPMKFMSLDCTMVTLGSETLLYINTSYPLGYRPRPRTRATFLDGSDDVES